MLIELLFGFVRAGERRSVRTDDCEISGLAERDAQFHEALADSNCILTKKLGELWIKTADIGDFMEQNEAIKDTIQQRCW